MTRNTCFLLALTVLFRALLAEEQHLSPKMPAMDTETQRIFGGSNARLDFAKSVARVTNSGSLCSGVLIAAQWVLTAAHCINVARARLTTVHIPVSSHSLGRALPVSKIYVLRAYFCDSQKDMAIIRLRSPATGRVVRRIKRAYDPAVPENRYVVAMGFGLTSYTPRRVPARAQWVGLRAATYRGNKFGLADSRCAAKSSRYHRPNLICAVAPGYPNGRAQSTCGGDSGGPLLTYFIKNRQVEWKVIGLNSFSHIRCDRPNAVDYFTRVSSFDNDIVNVMAGRTSAWLEVM